MLPSITLYGIFFFSSVLFAKPNFLFCLSLVLRGPLFKYPSLFHYFLSFTLLFLYVRSIFYVIWYFLSIISFCNLLFIFFDYCCSFNKLFPPNVFFFYYIFHCFVYPSFFLYPLTNFLSIFNFSFIFLNLINNVLYQMLNLWLV